MYNNQIYIIAELSANHLGDKDIAIKTIKEIAKSGANAVKVQTFKPESLTLNLKYGYFQPRKEGLWKGYTPWELYSKASLPYEWHYELKEIANSLNLDFFSTPFDFEAVDFLMDLDVPMFKVASLEVNDLPLISYIASKGKPILISTGVAEEDDIKQVINECKKNNNDMITLLKCTSNYPAKIQDANLKTLIDMKSKFGYDVGISDHTPGDIVPITAVGLGISVIEKHFTIDRKLGGPDAAFSMEPKEFKQMVERVRKAESAIGKVNYYVSKKDKLRRRSIFVVKNIKKDEKFSNKNIKSIRPGFGMSPYHHNLIIGKKALVDLEVGTPLQPEFINNFKSIGNE
jgi:pseudaminic acid synthase